MKYSSILLITFFFVNLSSAQELKPTRGTITSQVGISLAVFSDNVNSLGLNGRYFSSSQLAFRFSYNTITSKQVSNFYENSDGSGGSGSYTQKDNDHVLFLGVEKHFKGTKRLSPFVGVELGYGFGKRKGTGDNADETSYQQNFQLDVDQKFNGIAINAFLGFDYWIAEGLYVGIEYAPLGKTFNKSAESTRTETNAGISVKTVRPKSVYNELSTLNAMPFFRLGWRFN